jgi:hypothetical protein
MAAGNLPAAWFDSAIAAVSTAESTAFQVYIPMLLHFSRKIGILAQCQGMECMPHGVGTVLHRAAHPHCERHVCRSVPPEIDNFDLAHKRICLQGRKAAA